MIGFPEMDSECLSCILTLLLDILSPNVVIFVAVADPGSFNNSVAGQQVCFNF